MISICPEPEHFIVERGAHKMRFNYRRTPYDDGIPWDFLPAEDRERIKKKIKDSWKFKIGRCCMTCDRRGQLNRNYCQCALTDRKVWIKAKCLAWKLSKNRKRLVKYESLVDTYNLIKFPEVVDFFYKPAETQNEILHVGAICVNCDHFTRSKCALKGSPREKPWSFGACRKFKLSTKRALTSQWAKIFRDMGLNTSGNQWKSRPTRQRIEEELEKLLNDFMSESENEPIDPEEHAELWEEVEKGWQKEMDKIRLRRLPAYNRDLEKNRD
jgi:hypothetical protein